MSTRRQLLNLVKESKMPYAFKVEIFNRYNNGVMTKLTNALMKYVPTKVKMCANVAKSCTELVLRLLMIPFHDLKSLVTILSWMTFYVNVLQERSSLVDNVPLDTFLMMLSAVYIACLLIKLATAFTLSLPEGNTRIRKCFLWMPFVVECSIVIRTIKETLSIHTLRMKIREDVGRLAETYEKEEEIKIIETMVKRSYKIEEKQKKLESYNFAAKALAVTASVSNLLQVGVIYISQLRNAIIEHLEKKSKVLVIRAGSPIFFRNMLRQKH